MPNLTWQSIYLPKPCIDCIMNNDNTIEGVWLDYIYIWIEHKFIYKIGGEANMVWQLMAVIPPMSAINFQRKSFDDEEL